MSNVAIQKKWKLEGMDLLNVPKLVTMNSGRIPSILYLHLKKRDINVKMDTQQEEKRKESLTKFNQYMQSMLPAEERAKFQKIGEKLYSSFDAQKGTLLAGQDIESIRLEEALAYVVESLKAGLHPKYLTYDEVHMLRAGYGDEWYKKWNYNKEDLPN